MGLSNPETPTNSGQQASQQDHSRCNASTEPIATEYFHCLVDQLPEAHDMAAQMTRSTA
ncbi:GL15424 [Drosophila persimilis]|uniref:GL15188 n=1 Tax=Drosophila persimilis TaxID=7234 RepID=B4H3L5_DROPE|nr:GL22378 [Drosophila persimilis]EDW30966.1 GL15188 [Drosophila persimilis]EDW36610.1 GL15991 [Drosophila persimilis]EDW38667.1 GL15424 [Drosophila persimilis]